MAKESSRRTNSITNGDVESDEDKDTLCGIGGFHPEWLQRFANTKFFLINFSIVAVLQGAYFTYMIGSMSTLEKRFAFESKVSGFILIADNLSQMVVSPIIGYLGTKWNRSRIIATGELLVALSCIMSAIPYFIYGPATHFLSDSGTFSNVTKYEVCGGKNDYELSCKLKHHSTVIPAVVILWFGSFINGLGYTAFYTVGLPYLDDNVKKKNSPIYLSKSSLLSYRIYYLLFIITHNIYSYPMLGTSATLRLLGPTLGFLLSSICLRWYENPLCKCNIMQVTNMIYY
jgi:MFS family permease